MHNNSTKERTIVASQASDTLHGSQMAPQPWRNREGADGSTAYDKRTPSIP